MRTVRYVTEAQVALANQIKYLIDNQAIDAAAALNARVKEYIAVTIAMYPATGRYVARWRIWECWIPDTRLIVWYEFSNSELVVLNFWHASQDRSAP